MESYCQELSRYIHLNPVRAEMVEAPEDHPWSSYGAYAGLKRKPFWLTTSLILSYFSPEEAVAQKSYREFVKEGLQIPIRNPLEEVYASTFLGSEGFIDRIWKKRRGQTVQDSRNMSALKFLAGKPSLNAIKEAVERVLGSSDRLSRKFGLYVSRQKCGYALREVKSFYGMKEAAVSQAVGRFRRAILVTSSLKKKLQQILNELELSNVET